jgi:hypothetical protein
MTVCLLGQNCQAKFTDPTTFVQIQSFWAHFVKGRRNDRAGAEL